MPANVVVRARIDENTKKKAAKVFKEIGLTTSSAFRMFLIRTVAEKRLPFELKPNAETIAAIEELERGEGTRFSTVEELMADLNGAGCERSTRFKRDYRRLTSGGEGKSIEHDLARLIHLLAKDCPLPVRYRDHALTGDWKKFRDCHPPARLGLDLSQTRDGPTRTCKGRLAQRIILIGPRTRPVHQRQPHRWNRVHYPGESANPFLTALPPKRLHSFAVPRLSDSGDRCRIALWSRH